VLGFTGTIILLAYPDIHDLADLQSWSVGLFGIAVGMVRGRMMTLQSDQAFGLVRLSGAADGVVVGSLMALFAAFQGAMETGLHAENPYEPTSELLMLLTSGYLLGRSVLLWLRARTGPHVDLREE
jgi:hypothetical protein